MKSWNLNDRRLVKRMLAGEEEAFRLFFDDHFPPLYRFALRRLGDADAAGEVAQEALCQALGKLETWRGEAALRSWLFTFCRHRLARHLAGRERRPRPVGLPEESPEIRAALEALALAEGEGPEADLKAKELAALVRLTLDHLPPRYGRVLTWKYLEEVPVREIARRLELGAKAAESLLGRARSAFREAFEALAREERTAWAFTESGREA